MAENFIEIQPLDLTVYGQVQYAFVASDAPGTLLTYADAAVLATQRRALAVETETTPIAEAVRKRTAKLEALGNALADVARALMSLVEEDLNSIETASIRGASASTLNTYEVKIDGSVVSSSQTWFTKAQLTKLQQNVKLEIDQENGKLQQTTGTLQGFLQKRDSAYSMIGKIQRKIDATASRTLGRIGG